MKSNSGSYYINRDTNQIKGWAIWYLIPSRTPINRATILSRFFRHLYVYFEVLLRRCWLANCIITIGKWLVLGHLSNWFSGGHSWITLCCTFPFRWQYSVPTASLLTWKQSMNQQRSFTLLLNQVCQQNRTTPPHWEKHNINGRNDLKGHR